MGYSADMIDWQAENDDWKIIAAERVPAVWAALEEAEVTSGIGHISWVNDPLEVERTKHETVADAVASVLAQYGWESTEADGHGNVILGWWGGDKLGSCWDGVTNAIAQGLDPAVTVTWIMSGEDGEIWAERLHASTVQTRSVRLVVDES